MRNLYSVKAFKVKDGVSELQEWASGFNQKQANDYSKQLVEEKEYDMVKVKKLPGIY